MTNTETAALIADQLAGGFNKIAAMVGGRDFMAGPGALQFKFMRTERTKANACRIEINSATDLYTVTFHRVAGTKVTKLGEFEGVFCGDLRAIFEKFTGLALGF